MKLNAFAWSVLLAALPASASAEPLLASIFSDHAVLQRDQPIRVWGQASPHARLTIDLSGQTVSAVADAQGGWSAQLPARQPGAPLTLTVRAGDRTQTVKDLLMGDVWLCSGQSNMEFPLLRALNGDTEVAAAGDSNIRLLHIGHISLLEPANKLPQDVVWQVSTPQSAQAFSAVCYFMGRDIKKTAGVPVGLIDASWGGSAIQAWLSHKSLATFKSYDEGFLAQAEYERSKEAGLARWTDMLNGWAYRNDPQSRAWAEPDFDDSQWQTMPAEDFWELTTPALQSFDGTIWLRAEVTLSTRQAAQGGKLVVGPIDDLDTSFVNGKVVGSTEGWNIPRSYPFAKGTLKAGHNVIAIRVVDLRNMGGAWGSAAEKGFKLDDGSFVPMGKVWRYKVSTDLSATGQPPHLPTGWAGLSNMYNGMIAPLAPYGLKGVAWYQGESNVYNASEYARLLPAMIADWRSAFKAPQLPFLMVQLASFGPYRAAPGESGWADLRDVQRRTEAADRQVGMATALDVGDIYEIHPTNKQQVGRRLAMVARKLAYGETTLAATGPTPLSVERRGDGVVVRFDQPLKVFGGAGPLGFELCDAAACHFVDGRVDGATVRITSVPDGVIKLRFAWSDSPIINLYGRNNLPTSPFEMDVR